MSTYQITTNSLSPTKNKIRLALYENLPSGGAKYLMLQNLNFLQNKMDLIIDKFSFEPLPDYFNNFLRYLKYIYISSPFISKHIATYINNNYDILLVYHSWLTKSPYFLRNIKIPTIYICHESLREFYEFEVRRSWSLKDYFVNLCRYPLKTIDINNIRKHPNITIVANSKHSKSILDDIYNTDCKIIYPGVNPNLYKNNNNKNKKENAVISVGSVNSLKGYDHIIRVLSLINKKHRPIFYIVGNGGNQKYITYLQALAKSLDVNLKIYLNVSKQQLINLYSRSKIFVYSPLNEPFGIVVLEALNSGLPIVGDIDGGGYVEVLDAESGFLIKRDNILEWKSKIETLLLSNSLRERIKQHNIKLGKTYSIYQYNDKLYKLLKLKASR